MITIVTHDELEVEAGRRGYEFARFKHGGALVWSRRRPDDDRQPIFPL